MTAAFYTEMPGPLAVAKLQQLWQRASGIYQLTDGATITVDISQAERTFSATLGGNRTFAPAGNGVALGDASLVDLDGKQILLQIKQDGTGTRVPTLNSAFRFGSDFSSVSFSTAAGKTDYLGTIYNHAAAKLDVIAFSRGY